MKSRNTAAIVLALATVSTAVQAQERIQFAEYSEYERKSAEQWREKAAGLCCPRGMRIQSGGA